MKRVTSLLICAALAAGSWALTVTLGPKSAPPAPSAPGVETAAPDPDKVQVTAPASAVPTQTPLPAEKTDGEPATATPDVSYFPATSEPVQSQPPAVAGVVAGPEYDYTQAVPESGAVEEDYFADAVFIGDSRTDGFRLFSGLSQGDYLVKTGLSVFKIDTDKIKVGEEKLTVAQALERKEYGKVYVCLGLNELGMYNDQGYYDHYAALLDVIRAAQPNATVYVQLLVPVNMQKCAEKGVGDYINNDQIAVYNGLLRQLAQEKQVFLTDPAQDIVEPETGEPPYDAVADGIHFQKEPYRQWLDYLKRHTVSKGE